MEIQINSGVFDLGGDHHVEQTSSGRAEDERSSIGGCLLDINLDGAVLETILTGNDGVSVVSDIVEGSNSVGIGLHLLNLLGSGSQSSEEGDGGTSQSTSTLCLGNIGSVSGVDGEGSSGLSLSSQASSIISLANLAVQGEESDVSGRQTTATSSRDVNIEGLVKESALWSARVRASSGGSVSPGLISWDISEAELALNQTDVVNASDLGVSFKEGAAVLASSVVDLVASLVDVEESAVEDVLGDGGLEVGAELAVAVAGGGGSVAGSAGAGASSFSGLQSVGLDVGGLLLVVEEQHGGGGLAGSWDHGEAFQESLQLGVGAGEEDVIGLGDAAWEEDVVSVDWSDGGTVASWDLESSTSGQQGKSFSAGSSITTSSVGSVEGRNGVASILEDDLLNLVCLGWFEFTSLRNQIESSNLLDTRVQESGLTVVNTALESSGLSCPEVDTPSNNGDQNQSKTKESWKGSSLVGVAQILVSIRQVKV